LGCREEPDEGLEGGGAEHLGEEQHNRGPFETRPPGSVHRGGPAVPRQRGGVIMTRPEFLAVIGYVAAGIGKALPAESLEVYFDCLGDLPLDVLKLAAKRVVLEHRWATFPTVAELRAAAAETMQGQVAELSPAEAWAIAWRVVGSTDPEVEGSFQRASKGVPPLVVEAIRAFGLN